MESTSTIKEIAAVLHATEPMADQFARRVQERVGHPVPPKEILAVLRKISSKRLSMDKVVAKVRQQQKKNKKG